jgi:hypothetical protein
VGGGKQCPSKTTSWSVCGYFCNQGILLTLQVLFVLLQLCLDLTSSLNRLLDVSDDDFWRTGWVHIRVQHQMAFIFNGFLLCFYCFSYFDKKTGVGI